MERKNLKKKSHPKKQPISKKNIITSLILIGFAFFGSYLIYFILQVALDTQTPMVVVVSGSMEPQINKGDLLFLRGMDAEDIKEQDSDHEGDIIVYDARGLWEGAPEDPIVHRVVDKYREDGRWYFITKGDANAKVDEEPVSASRVIGVVCGRVPYVGWVKIVMSDYGLFIPILIILSVPLIISILWDLIKDEEEQEEEEEEKIVSMKELILEKQAKAKNQNKDKTEVKKSSEDEFDF
jgi:signal peptidase